MFIIKKVVIICIFAFYFIFNFSACRNIKYDEIENSQSSDEIITTPSSQESLNIAEGTYSSVLNKPFYCANLKIKNILSNSFEFILSFENFDDRIFQGVAKITANISELSYTSDSLKFNFTVGDNYINLKTEGTGISDDEVVLTNSKFVLNRPPKITADEACNKVTEYWNYYSNFYDDQSDFYRGGTKYYTIIIDRGEKAVEKLYVNSITGSIYNGDFDSEDEGILTETLNK